MNRAANVPWQHASIGCWMAIAALLAGCQERAAGAGSASGPGEAQSRTVEPKSFDDFARRQQACCDALMKHLNAGIDWLVVLDTSGSFAPKDVPVSHDLPDLVRAIPMQEKDTIEIGFFASGYRPPQRKRFTVTSGWLAAVRDERFTRNRIDADLLPSHWGQRGQTTDIAQLPMQLARDAAGFAGATAASSGSGDPRSPGRMRYIIVLTDGLHEPQGGSRHRSLFEADDHCQFADSAVRVVRAGGLIDDKFQQPARGLFFVIDSSTINPRQRLAVESDWHRVTTAIEQDRMSNGGPWPVHAKLWTASSSPVFDAEELAEIARRDLVVPCIQVSLAEADKGFDKARLAWGAPHFASYGRAQTLDQLAVLGDGTPALPHWDALELPDDAGQGITTSTLTVKFLARGDPSRQQLRFKLHDRRDQPILGGVGRPESPRRNDNAVENGWQPREFAIDLPASLPVLARFQTPWRLDLDMVGGHSPPSVQLKVKRHDGGFMDALRHADERNNYRGQGFMFWALVALLFSFGFALWYPDTVTVGIRVIKEEDEAPFYKHAFLAAVEGPTYSRRHSSRLVIKEKIVQKLKEAPPPINTTDIATNNPATPTGSPSAPPSIGQSITTAVSTPAIAGDNGDTSLQIPRTRSEMYANSRGQNASLEEYYIGEIEEVVRDDGPNKKMAKAGDLVIDVLTLLGVVYVVAYYDDKHKRASGESEVEQFSFMKRGYRSIVALFYGPDSFWVPVPVSNHPRKTRSAFRSDRHVWYQRRRVPKPTPREVKGGEKKSVNENEKKPQEGARHAWGAIDLHIFTTLHEKSWAWVLRCLEALAISATIAFSFLAIGSSFCIGDPKWLPMRHFLWIIGFALIACFFGGYVYSATRVARTWYRPLEDANRSLRRRRFIDTAIPFLMYWMLGMAIYCTLKEDDDGHRVCVLFATFIGAVVLRKAYLKLRDSLVKRSIRRMEPLSPVEFFLEIAIARLGS